LVDRVGSACGHAEPEDCESEGHQRQVAPGAGPQRQRKKVRRMPQLQELNTVDVDTAVREFLSCCGSRKWAELMAASRPFASSEQMAERADAIWWQLAPVDWLQAFAAHPRIGERLRPCRAESTSGPNGWSAQEQRGSANASDDVRERLKAANQNYETRFGHIFIVCATGKSAGEMLQMLERRLSNDPAQELRVAAEEQQKITRLRLVKLLDDDHVIQS
jgi:OHCU decarboxylase